MHELTHLHTQTSTHARTHTSKQTTYTHARINVQTDKYALHTHTQHTHTLMKSLATVNQSCPPNLEVLGNLCTTQLVQPNLIHVPCLTDGTQSPTRTITLYSSWYRYLLLHFTPVGWAASSTTHVAS